MHFIKLIKQILAFFCLGIFLGTLTAGAAGAFPPTTCSVTILGTSGNLFCNFNVDLRETKHDFEVQRYDLDSADTEPDRVLVCFWKYPANLTCQVSGNYSFSGHVSDEAVIEIPKVTKDTEGRYGCQIIPPDAEMRFCTLSLSERRPVSTPKESTPGQSVQPVPSNMDTSVPPNMHQWEKASSPISETALTIIMPFAVVAAFVAGIAIGRFLLPHCTLLIKAKNFLSSVICHQSREQEGNEEHAQQHKPCIKQENNI